MDATWSLQCINHGIKTEKVHHWYTCKIRSKHPHLLLDQFDKYAASLILEIVLSVDRNLISLGETNRANDTDHGRRHACQPLIVLLGMNKWCHEASDIKGTESSYA